MTTVYLFGMLLSTLKFFFNYYCRRSLVMALRLAQNTDKQFGYNYRGNPDRQRNQQIDYSLLPPPSLAHALTTAT